MKGASTYRSRSAGGGRRRGRRHRVLRLLSGAGGAGLSLRRAPARVTWRRGRREEYGDHEARGRLVGRLDRGEKGRATSLPCQLLSPCSGAGARERSCGFQRTNTQGTTISNQRYGLIYVIIFFNFVRTNLKN
jgi:hypothetical protein